MDQWEHDCIFTPPPCPTPRPGVRSCVRPSPAPSTGQTPTHLVYNNIFNLYLDVIDLYD